jgi:hypothetical protein
VRIRLLPFLAGISREPSSSPLRSAWLVPPVLDGGPGIDGDLPSSADGALIDGLEPKEPDVVRCVIYLRVSIRKQAERARRKKVFRSRPNAKPELVTFVKSGGCSPTKS